MMRCKKLSLTVLCTVLACFGFYYTLQNHGQMSHRKRKTQPTQSEAECLDLKSFIYNSTMKKFKGNFWGQFLKTINAIQGCPWIENRTENNLLQSQLKKCCNASYAMMVTQENTPVGKKITFDASKKEIKVNESLYHLFPKNSPFQKPIRTCSVVGNGGILKNSFCGSEIDQADFVFRLNLPPLNATDVGTKTNLVSANLSILVDKYGSLLERRKAFIKRIKTYGSALVLFPPFPSTKNTDVSFRALYTLEDFDMSSRVVFFNLSYLINLTNYWKKMQFKFRQLSSGLMLASTAIEVCEKVTLYGFWPFSQDLDNVSIPHHYYDNMLPKPGVHSMSDEFYNLLKMHSRGLLQLTLGQCY